MTLNEVARAIRDAYVVEHRILREGADRILVTLAERHTNDRREFLENYRIAAGDALGIYIPGVLGE